ncbi:MAG TPA: MBL fold metallo-hydrolase [Actinomycetes bacterium]|jgi:glyoxylase-like metal-dependent hydrolase (beta-lactamase superfamily II)|nr:MBL fold metallo-hydrolase [Actinomycetes bacterium]
MTEAASAKPFASSADLTEQQATLEELADGVYAYTAQGDPNCGAVVGDDCVMAIEARATPVLAQAWIDELRTVTDKPIRYLALTHYHAVRTLGASAFGSEWIIAHERTRALIEERGAQDFESEARRFPRLFRAIDSIPGLTWPTVTFSDELTVWLGRRRVELRHLGRGHTEGDLVVWLPRERVLFAGDLVEAQAAPYMGDAFVADWSGPTLARLAALDAAALVGGRGPAVRGAAVAEAIAQTRDFLATVQRIVGEVVRREGTVKEAFDLAHAALEPRYGGWPIFEHCMPFNVQRAWDECSGLRPRIWTAARDRAVWDVLQG